MNRLLEIGFEPAGHWLLNAGALDLDLSRHASQQNILYAFVSDGEVMYVGKTRNRLYTRMSGYRNPGPSQCTNVRNNARIRALLQKGAAVDILALPDNGLLHYGQFHFNLAAGLEDSLIAEISPSWNGSATSPAGATSLSEKHQSDARSGTEPAEPQINTDSGAGDSEFVLCGAQAPQTPRPITSFPLVVHPTYYEKGFFNVGVSYAELFGGGGQKIDIFCGDADGPIIGMINRTANHNRTPRIMGGRGLRDWFQRHMREMQKACVTVLSPAAIRIEPQQG
ncbi:MAG: GIY-YIG nuclease family protein [Gemmataceae bacterium]